MFVRYEDLDRKNCVVKGVRFVKSMTKRPKAANVAIDGTAIILEAKLHTFDRRIQKTWWDNKESFEPKTGCYGHCGATHMTVFIHNDKLFKSSKAGVKEFKNPWLLRHVMNNMFKERV